MPGIDPEIMQHHLSVDPKAKGGRVETPML